MCAGDRGRVRRGEPFVFHSLSCRAEEGHIDPTWVGEGVIACQLVLCLQLAFCSLVNQGLRAEGQPLQCEFPEGRATGSQLLEQSTARSRCLASTSRVNE